MRRKLFTFLVAFLATLSGAVWGQEPTEVVLQESDKEALKLGDGIYHVTGSNKKGIEIKRGTTPTIILDGIKIEVTGAAIEVNGGAKPTFILKGTNTIVSEKGPAISVPHDVSTQATFQGDGLLDINMKTVNTVAIGNAYQGSETIARTCGNIIINGGTINTNGIIGKFYGLTEIDAKGLTLDKDAVLICNGEFKVTSPYIVPVVVFSKRIPPFNFL